jgi:hypothetical protein
MNSSSITKELIAKLGWPPFLEEAELPKMPAYFDFSEPEKISDINFRLSRIVYHRFELYLRVPLIRRYSSEDVRVKHQYRAIVSTKLSSKRDKYSVLCSLVDHPNTLKYERETAERRIKEITRNAVQEVLSSYPELSRRVNIDRVELFFENLEVLLEGRGGKPEDGYDSIRPVEYFAYARNEEELQFILDEVHRVTDEYKRIPKRLGGR